MHGLLMSDEWSDLHNFFDFFKAIFYISSPPGILNTNICDSRKARRKRK